MKKRVEKVVEWIKSSDKYLTHLKKYNVQAESGDYYIVIDDSGDLNFWDKEDFKAVSEREVLEFEVNDLTNKNAPYYNPCYQAVFNSKIDLTNYDLKVIATPKDKTYEEMSKEELIEIINELKAK